MADVDTIIISLIQSGIEWKYRALNFVHPDGVVYQYDKRHLFGFGGESQRFTAGDKRVVISYFGWNFFPIICYDVRFSGLTRTGLSLLTNFPVITYRTSYI